MCICVSPAISNGEFSLAESLAATEKNCLLDECSIVVGLILNESKVNHTVLKLFMVQTGWLSRERQCVLDSGAGGNPHTTAASKSESFRFSKTKLMSVRLHKSGGE